MKLMVNVRRSQLRGVLEELVKSFPDMDIVINIKEEESKEITSGYQRVTREQLTRLGKETGDAFLH
jgi:predicted glycosyltransferase